MKNKKYADLAQLGEHLATSKGSGVQISQSVRGGMGSFRYFSRQRTYVQQNY